MSPSVEQDENWMRRAIDLARRGQGRVEPNPMVGCVLVQGNQLVAEGWHRQFGGDHAEVDALNHAVGPTRGATAYVTLEPCCHHGKTPPCIEALIQAGIQRVVVAQVDPFEQVSGKGMAALREAGIETEVGVLEAEAKFLNAPYLYRIRSGLPWVIAKWAMTLDGRIATRTGDSQWISNETSRQRVHEIRSRVDGVMVGIGTALADDPLLTPRPAKSRQPTRIVADSNARLPLDSKLVGSTKDFPCLVAVGPGAEQRRCEQLASLGCEIWRGQQEQADERLEPLLTELSNRGMTNLLVEGGGRLLGSLFDQNLICETHIFIAPKITGGHDAISPIGGIGIEQLADAHLFSTTNLEELDGDIHFWGHLKR
ncbi:MAG: bifunctional diaminohydroxyphosphoribosylaminopyrimidine deaminase/5-amino-6-(5-phosphoribosylamino)uracil reductase RibD [Mariniblastus sp.]|nr:bifunctional diaminohydroxyphosphoribosylaminopyrimidine deaminase/5-amino-6-(5-phosphoribosylamino)uracil reductase RibD [Mariniblastus sp.]